MIEISDLHITKTFSELFAVDEDFDPLAYVVDKSIGLIEKMWGRDRPTHFVAPDPSKPIPRYMVQAWLSGPAKVPGQDGSHLIVTWFADRIPEDPLYSAVVRVTAAGGWEKLAADYEH